MGLSELTNFIKTQTFSLGFIACGITRPIYNVNAVKHLLNWLNNNYNAGMNYFLNNLEKRIDISNFYPEAKSVVVVLINYFSGEMAFDDSIPKISKYALGYDYHFVISEKLKILLNTLKEKFSPEIDGKIFVDTSPILEKTLAVQAGLGWIGKNCLLINPRYGSYVFIGGVVLNVELIYDSPFTENYCGNCDLCLKACPTNALVYPYVLDARKCISYLTIENKDDLPKEYKEKFNGYIYGCDICQDVCPWNKNLPLSKEPLFRPNEELLKLKKEDWLSLDEEKFNKLFKKSSVKRIKYKGFKRNLNFVINL